MMRTTRRTLATRARVRRYVLQILFFSMNVVVVVTPSCAEPRVRYGAQLVMPFLHAPSKWTKAAAARTVAELRACFEQLPGGGFEPLLGDGPLDRCLLDGLRKLVTSAAPVDVAGAAAQPTHSCGSPFTVTRDQGRKKIIEGRLDSGLKVAGLADGAALMFFECLRLGKPKEALALSIGELLMARAGQLPGAYTPSSQRRKPVAHVFVEHALAVWHEGKSENALQAEARTSHLGQAAHLAPPGQAHRLNVAHLASALWAKEGKAAEERFLEHFTGTSPPGRARDPLSGAGSGYECQLSPADFRSAMGSAAPRAALAESMAALQATFGATVARRAPPEYFFNTKWYSSTYLATGFANVRAGTWYPPEH